MVSKMMSQLFAFLAFFATVRASFETNVSSSLSVSRIYNSTSNALITSSYAVYPPPGLLDSLLSMKIREDLYQSDLTKHAARADIEPALSWTNPVSLATGVLAPMRNIESVCQSLLLPLTPTILQTAFTIQTSPPAPPTVLSGPARGITLPTPSNSPPLHVAISAVWIFVITFITITTLATIFGGLGNALIIIVLINLICAMHLQPLQVDAHPDIHRPHSAIHHRDPARRPIGGLRPGPVGKIPCGPLKDTIGTKGGHFLKGVHRKIGGLTPALPADGDLMCDVWANANFPRGLAANLTSPSDNTGESVDFVKDFVVVPTPPSDDTEETTAIFTTTTSTLWVTVPDPSITATIYRLSSSAPSSPTPSEEAPSSDATEISTPVTTSSEEPYSTATETAEPRPLSPFETPYYGQRKESSAVPPAVTIRTSFTYLLLLYLTGMLVCLLLGGSSYALSFLLVSFALAAVIAGAEGAAVPDGHPHYSYGSYGGRMGGLKVGTIGAPGAVKLNNTRGEGRSLEETGLKKFCGEVFCHKWSNFSRSPPSLVTTKPTPTYADLAKRLETVYITVPPTSGVIQVEGPQIVPVTVVSTAYAETEAATVTVDAVTEETTRTINLPPISTLFISPGTSMNYLGTERIRTVTRGETTITANATLPSSTYSPHPPPPPTTETLWLTTTVTAPSSSVTSSSSTSQTSEPSTSPSSATPEPSAFLTTSQSSRLEPTKLYFSFVETNLYCFLFPLIGLQIVLTTSHPLVLLGSMAMLMVTGGAVLQMCAGGSSVLRCNGVVM